ncbi:hypothetical protein PGB90_008825 [Kerria lacca]
MDKKWTYAVVIFVYLSYTILATKRNTLNDVSQFLIEWEDDGSDMCYQMTSATWNYITNLTEYNKNKMLEIHSLNSKFDRVSWKNAISMRWNRNLEPLTQRQVKLLSMKRHYALNDTQFSELQQLIIDMKDIYAKARICTFKAAFSTNCELSLDPDAQRILAKSRDYEEQLHVWRNWRDSVGPFIKPKYQRYIELINESARRFENAGYEERSIYELPDLESELATLWTQVLPLYKHLYTYVRRRLVQYYGTWRIKPDGPIPAHILGNMWAQSWKHIIDIVLPFQGKRRSDFTSEMLRQGYTAHKIFQVAEEFFTSMGMKPMPAEFWRHSMIIKPEDRAVVCKSSAWDFCNGKDYRIKQCTEITMDDLFTTHHEMAHIQYYLQYSSQHLIFRDGPNPAFHEAIGDMILLSVKTSKHLHRIGLLNNVTDDYETSIDYLMEMALDKVAYLPFSYLVDLWRWNVFRDGTNDMNQKWWDLRFRYQGIVPPMSRNENDFDPASKYHIIADIPYAKYFIGLIIQFQLHESVCVAAGHVGPLHTCDIYRSTEAGKLLTDIMSVGASLSWREVLKIATHGKSSRLETRPMIEYFKPLQNWLEIQNQDEPIIGWVISRPESVQNERLERTNSATHRSCGLIIFKLLLLNAILMTEEKDTKSSSNSRTLKLICLTTLTFQNAAYIQIYKYSRLGQQEDLYTTSTVICVAEFLKIDMLHMSIPAVTYILMTNLMYISAIHLDVLTFQIVNQLKIPATVFFSILFLGSSFRKTQYLSIVILFIGVLIVQLSEIDDRTTKNFTDDTTKITSLSNKTIGVVTGLVACVLSGFAGVYFEKILKSTSHSVWVRNVQMSLLSILPAFLTAFAQNWYNISRKGFFYGYNELVWIVIFLHASGGLIVALSVKLADNISKGYATSASIIVSSISATIILHYKFDYMFACGALLVVISIPLYTFNFNSSKIKPLKLPSEGHECYI